MENPKTPKDRLNQCCETGRVFPRMRDHNDC